MSFWRRILCLFGWHDTIFVEEDRVVKIHRLNGVVEGVGISKCKIETCRHCKKVLDVEVSGVLEKT